MGKLSCCRRYRRFWLGSMAAQSVHLCLPSNLNIMEESRVSSQGHTRELLRCYAPASCTVITTHLSSYGEGHQPAARLCGAHERVTALLLRRLPERVEHLFCLLFTHSYDFIDGVLPRCSSFSQAKGVAEWYIKRAKILPWAACLTQRMHACDRCRIEDMYSW